MWCGMHIDSQYLPFSLNADSERPEKFGNLKGQSAWKSICSSNFTQTSLSKAGIEIMSAHAFLRFQSSLDSE